MNRENSNTLIDDGGAAFPVTSALERFDDKVGQYRTVYEPGGGMSLRDYFAAAVLPAIYAQSMAMGTDSQESIVIEAYEIADTMIAQRKVRS